MSQEKVNKYKEEKANRHKIMKREKRNRMIGRIVGIVICLAIVGWIGYSIYDRAATKIATAQTEVNLSALDDYLNELYADDTEDDDADDGTADDATDNSADGNADDAADDTADNTEE